MVGVNTGSGTEWSHLIVDNERLSGPIITGGDAVVVRPAAPPGPGYVVIEVPVSQAEAARAAATVQSQLEVGNVGRYGLLSKDCTTFSSEVLDVAGLSTPRVSTPALNAAAVALQSPAAVAPLRVAATAAVVGSAVLRTTQLEEELQMSMPSEHGY